jgi:putative tricarboxylic transport membrane protein
VALPLLTNNLTGSTSLSFHDVTSLAILGTEYIVMAVNANSPLKRGRDVVEQLKQNPGSIVIGISPGLGTHSHIAVAMVARAAGVDARKMRTVVYAGGSEAVTALLGGHVDAVTITPGNLVGYFASGQMRALGIAAPQRSGGALAGIPTWREQGIEAVCSNWRGIIGPKGLSTAQITYWDDIFAKTVRTDDWKKELENNSLEPLYLNSAESLKFLEQENQRLKAVLSDIGLAK